MTIDQDTKPVRDGASLPLRQVMLTGTTVPLAYQLNFVANSITRALYAQMEAQEGIGRSQFVVLWCLSIGGQATAQDIADATRRPKNSVSRAVQSLEARGLVSRSHDANDQRRQPMTITPSGKATLARLVPLAEAMEARLRGALSPEEEATFARLMAKVAAAFA